MRMKRGHLVPLTSPFGRILREGLVFLTPWSEQILLFCYVIKPSLPWGMVRFHTSLIHCFFFSSKSISHHSSYLTLMYSLLLMITTKIFSGVMLPSYEFYILLFKYNVFRLKDNLFLPTKSFNLSRLDSGLVSFYHSGCWLHLPVFCHQQIW